MMKKGVLFFCFLLVMIPIVAGDSIDPAIKKITHYAQEYETGNIDYAKLIVYTSSLREDLAESMGAVSQGHDAVLYAAQLENALGRPNEYTKWAWVENEDREKKLDSEAPAWRKIVFDGTTIQIWLSAWPNVIVKDGNDVLVYRLHFDIQFKQIGESVDIKEEIKKITALAEDYDSDPNSNNLDKLARESVNIENIFNNAFNQNPAKCEATMNSLLGSENKGETQKILVQQVNFFEGEKVDAILRLEMCDDCSWNWINLNMWFESRGNFNYPEEYNSGDYSRYNGMGSDRFEEETKRVLEEARLSLESGDFEGASRRMGELRMLTDAWNEDSNNIWEEVEGDFQIDWESMSEAEGKECQRTYCWIKKEQERRDAEKNLRAKNYEERKEFYLGLFKNYDKKEFYFEQEQWEKRIFESFVESGEEVCDNNRDDNDNEAIDCAEAQCGGKVCGYESTTLGDGSQEDVALYCIASTCQQREEVIIENGPVCGNHICEEGEADSEELFGTCNTDCVECPSYTTPECNGNIVFSGADANGCQLEPICVEEDVTCIVDSDCRQPLCGNAGCVEGVCETVSLQECREAECVSGEEKVQACINGENIKSDICKDGVWVKTGVTCEEGEEAQEIIEEKQQLVGEACVVRSDCGGEQDVCSNGQCVALPGSRIMELDEQEIIVSEGNEVSGEIRSTPEGEENSEIEQRERPGEEVVEEIGDESEESEPESEVEGSTEADVTGNIIFSFFQSMFGRFTALAVDNEGEENGGESTGEDDTSQDTADDENGEEGMVKEDDEIIEEGDGENGQKQQDGEENNDGNQNGENDYRDEERYEDEREEREREDNQRMENECRERCDRECYDMEIRPCTESCIWEGCGDEFECDVDEVRVSCESSCRSEQEINSCTNGCFDKCLVGENTWVEPERDEREMERLVFSVGGSCKELQGRNEGSIWLNGWGENLQDFHMIKNKYYSNEGNSEWCERDLKNLIQQRKELEASLDEGFASWFFDNYVANSANGWERHMSGIFNLYWQDVDLSRQIAERMQCAGKSGFDPQLIHFEYETDYGSVEFWEEIKSTRLEGSENEVEIVSPYMKIWLFPSRDFFKSEMLSSMENHRMPGSSEEQLKKQNGLSKEDKNRMREDKDFQKWLERFNGKYGNEMLIQFKDFITGDIFFNIYVRVNEKEMIYFEPMPPEESPEVDVVITMDVEKILDIVEFEESGRVELESPPWDKKPRVGVVKGAIGGAQMYLKFRALMSSMEVTPAAAEGDAKEFMGNFFGIIMGDDGQEQKDFEDGEGQEKQVPEGWDEQK